MTSYIRIETVQLSDGSEVFDVIVPAMHLHATTEKDAQILLNTIHDAIKCYTVDSVEMVAHTF